MDPARAQNLLRAVQRKHQEGPVVPFLAPRGGKTLKKKPFRKQDRERDQEQDAEIDEIRLGMKYLEIKYLEISGNESKMQYTNNNMKW